MAETIHAADGDGVSCRYPLTAKHRHPGPLPPTRNALALKHTQLALMFRQNGGQKHVNARHPITSRPTDATYHPLSPPGRGLG